MPAKRDSDEKIEVLSFFSGAGFLDIGFLRQGGFNIVWHNECNSDFASAYEFGVRKLGYNTTNDKIQNLGRIEELTAMQVLIEAFNGNRPEKFGIIGGPPCPDFSRAGKNHGGNGANGQLTGKYVEMIHDLSPTFFLLENVPGLLETKKHRVYLFSILEKLHHKYAIDIKILNALEHGVPQNRRRVFIVGIKRNIISRRDNYGEIIKNSSGIVSLDVSDGKTNKVISDELNSLHWFPWPIPRRINGRPIPKHLTVAHAFSKVKNHPNAKDTFVAHCDRIKNGTIKEGDVSRKSFKRLSRSSYSPNAAYGNNEVHIHPTKNRRISVAEALSLQSVPEQYAFPEGLTLTAKFKAIGNGVPVELAQAVAKSINNFISE